MGDILTFNCEPARSLYTRYRLDPVFARTPDGAVIGIIRYNIYLDGRFVGSRRTHAQGQNALGRLSMCLRQVHGMLVRDLKDPHWLS